MKLGVQGFGSSGLRVSFAGRVCKAPAQVGQEARHRGLRDLIIKIEAEVIASTVFGGS